MSCTSAEFGDLFRAQVTVTGGDDHADIMNSSSPTSGVRNGASIGLSSSDVSPYYLAYNAIKMLTGYLEPSRVTTYETMDTPATYSRTLTGGTKDYILFDKENGVYVYLDATFSGSLPDPDSGSGSFALTLNLVVEFGGGIFTDAILSLTAGMPLLPVETVTDTAKYFKPIMPPRVFAPPYCKQGAFKHVAYSEIADTAPVDFTPTQDGPVFLMSLPLSISSPDSAIQVPTGSFNFIPLNFYSFIGGFGGLSVAEAVKPALEGKVFYKHFADNAFVDWTVDPTVQFDPHYSELYRI